MHPWNDERVEKIISVLLRSGVMLSAAVVLAGGICFLYQNGDRQADYHAFRASVNTYRTVRAVLKATASGDCRAIMQLGLLLLIATPIARVAFSLVAFEMEHDRTYVALTSMVLLVLIYSLAGPH